MKKRVKILQYVVFTAVTVGLAVHFTLKTPLSTLGEKVNKEAWGCIKIYKTNLFSTNSTESKIITKLNKNTPVKIIKQKLGWAEVEVQQHKGWLKSHNMTLGLNCALAEDSTISLESTSTDSTFKPNQPLRLIRIENGKNLVQDNTKREFWVDSNGLWPKNSRVQKTVSKKCTLAVN